MPNLFANDLNGETDAEAELVARYTQRLLELARKQLPERVRGRVDPEDVLQSVYRSFFRRLKGGKFAFEDSHDVWRLLATMTVYKARNSVRFHQRLRRDVRREMPLQPEAAAGGKQDPAWPEPDFGDVEVMFDCLEQLLKRLPENYREIVVRRLEGDSIEQIGLRIKRSRRTVLRVLAHVQDLAAEQLESSV
jgi:RNA polymerase sigma-70 factor (ECF subfamily)